MSMNVSSNPNRSKAIGAGAVLGIAGMNAYFLPVTRDRFVRNAFDVAKETAEENIERLNESAVQLSNKKLKTENKLFLSQLGVAEDITEINTKCVELRKSITDDNIVKSLKKSFEDNFKSYKKSEAAMDNVASKAFSRIRWSNFTWGVAIGFILGHVIGMLGSSSNAAQPPQF